MKPRVFFYHYNKPASRQFRKPLLSVHFNKACHIVDHIVCNVPTYSVHRKTQPFCVMKGKCLNVRMYEQDGLNYAEIS